MFENKPTELLIGTNNPGKLRELADLLSAIKIKLRSLADFEDVGDIEETGLTFVENAELKASGYARQTALWTIADDSGLEVEALNGAPGVFSARFAGKAATTQQRIEKLLKELRGTNSLNGKAQFVCVMSLANPDGKIVHSEMATCQGRIASESRGENGMGFDSIFIPEGFDKTFGELPDSVKQQMSHRASASRKMEEFLFSFFK